MQWLRPTFRRVALGVELKSWMVHIDWAARNRQASLSNEGETDDVPYALKMCMAQCWSGALPFLRNNRSRGAKLEYAPGQPR